MDSKKRLNELSELAKSREKDSNPLITVNHSSVDFLTDEERREWYELKKNLPSYGEQAAAARERIRKRIQKRNKDHEQRTQS